MLTRSVVAARRGSRGFILTGPVSEDIERFKGNPPKSPEKPLNPAGCGRWPVDRGGVSPHDAGVLVSLRKKLLHPPRFWLLNFFGWLAFALVALLIRLVMYENPERALALTLTGESFGFLVSGVLREIYRRIGAGRFLRLPVFALALGLTLVAAAVQSGVVQVFVRVMGWDHFLWTDAQRWVLLALAMWFVYMSWSLGYFWLKAELAAQAEAMRVGESQHAAQKIELQLLRSQLDPHFLFNSLNGIATEIAPNPKTASEMLHELADYLRYSLDHRHDQILPLAVELDAVAAYLRIEKTRFGDQLVSEISADPAARASVVPSFLLQPLIENAVKHGFTSVPPPWHLAVVATRREGVLSILVRNSGHGRFGERAEGVGLDTVRRRLELHYPGRHEFSIGESAEGVTARLELEGEPCFA